MIAEREDDTHQSQGRTSCPVLTTERLVLRAPERPDAVHLANLANNIKVASMMTGMPHPYTKGDAETFICRVAEPDRTGCAYAVTAKHNSAFLGCAGLSLDHGGQLQLGFWLGEPHWGKGYATEAAHALVDLAFCAFRRAPPHQMPRLQQRLPPRHRKVRLSVHRDRAVEFHRGRAVFGGAFHAGAEGLGEFEELALVSPAAVQICNAGNYGMCSGRSAGFTALCDMTCIRIILHLFGLLAATLTPAACSPTKPLAARLLHPPNIGAVKIERPARCPPRPLPPASSPSRSCSSPSLPSINPCNSPITRCFPAPWPSASRRFRSDIASPWPSALMANRSPQSPPVPALNAARATGRQERRFPAMGRATRWT